MQIEINANKRDTQGTGASRRLRRAGRVPGVVYGNGVAAQAIDLNHKDLYFGLKNEVFHSSVLSLNLDGVKQAVLMRDFQMHPYKPVVLHIDFQRVDPNQKVYMKVPLHFVNAEVSPGVKLAGGVVSHLITEAEVLCLPGALPEFIEVDLSKLEAGQTVHLSDVALPAGVEFSSLARGEDYGVANILAIRGGAATEETEDTAA